MKKTLLSLLLMVLIAPWAANAQQALPYSYGFENNDLDAEGWTAQITSSSSGIYNAGSSVAYEGTYLFRFNYSETDGYLVSPLLSGTDAGVDMTFQYKEYSSTYGDEQFYVGYTTDDKVTDPADFTYGSIVTASLSWQEYTASLPAGTKRIAIQYVYNDAFYLYLDAFSFEAPGAVAKPTDLVVSNITAYGATLGWTENGTATSWQICVNDDETNLITTTTNPYTFTGLTPNTPYSVKVRAVAGGESSAWSSATSFTTNELCPDGKVCIGTGTATSSYIPTYSFYNYSLTQQIYTAEEIGAEGYILSVDFHCSGSLTRTFDIYMVSTTKSSFDGPTDWITVTEADKVFSGSVTFADGDWTTIEFDNPFEYDGRSNVALIVDDNTGSYVSSPSFYVFNATSQAIRIYSDGVNYDPENPSSYNGTVLSQKNRIRLEVGVPPTCPKPKNLAASDVTNHTATLTWTAGGEEAEWTVEYSVDDSFEDAASMTVTAPTAALTGLRAESVYYARVKANCGAGDESVWTDAISFETEIACPAPTNLTVSDVEPFAATVSWNGIADGYNLRYRVPRGFNYGFETAEGFVVDQFPPCTTYDGDGLYTYGIDGYTMPNNTANYVGSVVSFNDYWTAHSGDVMGVFMDAIPSTSGGATANDDYFITPRLTIAAGDHFIFWARSVTANYGLERMKVGVYGGDGTISAYFAGSADTYVEVPVDWTKYDYDLTDYVGQEIQLAINCVSADAFALFIDDLFVGDPTDDTWDVTLNNVTSPYALTGLTDETTYELQVQAACGGTDGVSEWVGTSFMTPSNCAAPTNLAANNLTYNGATLSWDGFHDTYNLQYRTAGSRVSYYFNDFNDENATGWTFNGSWIYGLADPIYNVAGSDNFFMSMGWSSLEEETIVSCELPAYESGAIVEFYYFAYQQANTFQFGFSTTTNEADAFRWETIDAPTDRYNLYQAELADDVKYVAWKATATTADPDGETGNLDCVFIDDFGIFGETIPAGEWQTANAVTSPYTLTGIADGTEFEWQVQGINPACDGGVTPWTNLATFTTPDACQVPEIDDVEIIEGTTSATVTWTGIQESYNIRYGAFEPAALYNFDDQVIPADWVNDTVYAWALTDTLTDAGYCLRSTNQGVANSSATISFTATYEAAGVISFDAMFMGEGSSTAWDKCIFKIDGTTYFAYGAIGEDWYNMAYYFAPGTHTFAWSYTKDSSVDPAGDFFAIDNIKIQLQGDTWTTVENVTGNTYNLTGLTPETVYAVQVQGIMASCDGGVTNWSGEYLFITPEATTPTQTIALAAGTNWFSTYLEITLDDLKAALVAALPNATEIVIKSKTQNTRYNGTSWRGNLTWDLSKMYLITVQSACEITLEGELINPADHPATILSGQTNWIAFPVNEEMTLDEAFANFNAIKNDVVKSKTGNARYTGTSWRASGLTKLEPGKGYLFNSATTDQNQSRTLIFPTSTSKGSMKGIGKTPTTIKGMMNEDSKMTDIFIDRNSKSIN